MSSRCRKLAGLLLLFAFGACGAKAGNELPPKPARVLRICADPNNLPFSNRRLEGFENEIAALLARDLGARAEYTWWAQRRGFFRNTLNASLCDVVMGVPTSLEMAWTTRPYYRSSYVFVTKRDGGPAIGSLDDPALRKLRIGVQVLGDDGANPPPVHALVRRGLARNLHGYSVYGDYRSDSPPAAIVRGVARGEVDVALAWGPMAGYFARRSPVPLRLVPVTPQIDPPFMPFSFDISMGTRRHDTALHQELDDFIRRRGPDIARLLDEYGVPRPGATPAANPGTAP
jgi:mxaJ protein